MGDRNVLQRLIDPIGGDDLDDPDRTLRLNLRRVERLAILSMITATMEGILSIDRGSVPNLVFCIVGGTISAIVFLIARQGQKAPRPHLRLLPEAYAVYLMMSSQAAGYFIALTGRMAFGYPIAFLVCAAFLIIPPRRFALIGLLTLAVFVAWTIALPFDGPAKLTHLYNTILMILAGMLARWGLHRLEELDDRRLRELRDANRQLAAYSAENEALMAVAAHDLRSPLQGLGNLFKILAARPPNSQQQWLEILGKADANVDSMLSLVGRILQSHEAEMAGRAASDWCDLRERIDLCVLRSNVLIEGAGVLVDIQGPDRARTFIDVSALDQILDNLLSNAIRFTPPGRKVKVIFDHTPVAFVEVADEGIGVPTYDRTLLFQKFRRGSLSPVNGARGSGLGLYIVRRFAEAAGGSVAFRPAERGQGSVFRVTFTDGPPEERTSHEHVTASPHVADLGRL